MSQTLLPCPFCGGEAVFERTGTSRHSCIVTCLWCSTRHESSSEGEMSGRSWNTRTPIRSCNIDYEAKFHQVMGLLRDLQMEHGTCQPRERRACTCCNAQDDLNALVSQYKGLPIVAVSV